MATTTIEWADRVWNPTTGCTQLTSGCDHCYALTQARRNKAMELAKPRLHPKYQRDGGVRSGPGFGLSMHPHTLNEPERWPGCVVFVNSMSDLFHEEVTWEFLRQVWDTMVRVNRHTYIVLTKRPERLRRGLGPRGIGFYAVDGLVPCPQPNIWLGVSVENADQFWRIRALQQTPAKVRVLSCEPLLGPLHDLPLDGIDWVIVGGESGPGARPMHPDWIRDIRDQCQRSGVAFFFKQWGEWAPSGRYDDRTDERQPWDHYVNLDGTTGTVAHWESLEHATNWTGTLREGYQLVTRVGKKSAGRILDSRTWDEMPARAGALL